ncbi:multifunctional protein ADE2-like [Lucilia sericata]|uniref:multifunctional protein ADE2-like n=1 Tax=Lucilia sericata TaxID=13632 RepID=UPI0018A88200|nr:multifunctional protein ADE2-like [Lucilia sericata]
MNVEFDVDEQDNILLADIIDCETWPAGDSRLMVDKEDCRSTCCSNFGSFELYDLVEIVCETIEQFCQLKEG